MKFGLFGGATVRGSDTVSDSSQDYEQFIDYICEAEDLGYASAFLVEHHFTGFNQVSATLSLLTYLAAKTSRIRLGTAVTVLPWHNPVLLAEQVATLDLLSKGRLDFGVGKGYRHNEFHGFCIPIEESHERYMEALEILKKALTSKERFSHHGKRWHFDDIVVEPSAVQRPHPPMWVGAGSPLGIENAAKDNFNLLLDQFGTPEVTGERIRLYREALAKNNLKYNPYRVGLTRALHIAMNPKEREEAHALRAKFLNFVNELARDSKQASSLAVPSSYSDTRLATEKAALIGDPEEIITRLKDLQKNGVEYVLLIDVGGSREALRHFAREVMPEFKEPAEATTGLAMA
jgi:alkanesulfonate monooxygenase SsuD/methylene tetrahydromethanopterin reductase-like flavin-dependent oxidoreductase (luciferase family)